MSKLKNGSSSSEVNILSPQEDVFIRRIGYNMEKIYGSGPDTLQGMHRETKCLALGLLLSVQIFFP